MVRTKKILSVILAIMMLMQTFVITNFAADIEGFTDFPTNSWSTEAMTAAVENGLLVGTSETTIEPQKNLTRAEFAAIVTRAFGATKTADISKFKDVDENDWFYGSVAKVVQMGVMNGTSDTTFAPNAFMRREEVILAMARILFVDGTDISVLDQFSDRSKIDTWSIAAIAGMVAEDYVHGYEDGTIRPQNHITREELAQLFHNIFKTYISEDGEYDSVAKKGSVIVRSEYVTLKDVTIDGDLIMADGVGEGDFRISDVHVTGKIIARGGEGMNYFVNVTSDGKVIVNDPNGTVNFYNYKEEDTPFKGGNVIENTPATFLEREPAKPSSGGGVSVKYTLSFYESADATDPMAEPIGAVKQKGSYVVKEEDVPTDAAMEKAGFKFIGWTDGVETKNRDYFVGAKIKDVDGDWKPIYKAEYTITFVTDAGETGLDKLEDETIAAGEIPEITVDATKEFKGWTTVEGSDTVNFTNDALVAGTVKDVFGDETEIKLYPVIVDKGSAVKYVVSFNANGGSGSMAAQEIEEGVAANLNANAFTRADYTFAGWNTKADGTGTSYADGASITLTGSITLYAQWTYTPATKYYVTFDANGGSGSMDEQEFVSGVAGALNANAFTRNDYVFAGWNTEEDGTGTAYADGASITLTESITLYAQWTRADATKYYVTFNANGGSGSMAAQAFDKNVAGTLNANAFTRDDYTFAGWNTKADGTGTAYADGASITLTESITLYAQWTSTAVTKYYVTFDANGGSGSMVAQEIEEGTVANLNVNAFTRNDYVFAGWNTEADGTGTAYADGAPITLTGSITLYAQWTWTGTTKYYVTFVANGGSGSMDEQEFVSGVAGTLKANAFTRNDYVFAGWNTKDDGTGTAYADGASVTLTESITLYAQWTFADATKYYVTFNANGGYGSMAAQGLDKNVAGTLKANAFTREDYTFAGWNTKADGTGTAYADGASITLTESITLYAQWASTAVTKYYVTFNANGGSGSMDEQEFVADTAQNLNANSFTRANYSFAGWNTEADGTGTAYADEASVTLTESITLYAQWTSTAVTKYYVTFDANGGSGTMDEQEFVSGVAGTLKANAFTRNDYVFAGWNTKADGTGTAYADGASITLTESITLYAQWTSAATTKYYVTFNANGGTGIMAPQAFDKNTAGNLNANAFARADYRFTGWNTKADGTGTSYADEASITLTESITLYAQWEHTLVSRYFVTFVANGGNGTITTQEFEEGVAENLDANPFEKLNYEFTGWNTKEDGTGTSYDDGASVTLTESITLYAQWESTIVIKYFVTFVGNGGSGSMDEQEFVEGVAANLDANTFTRKDYVFKGWNTKEDGTGTSYDDLASVTLTESITLYAQWEFTIATKYMVTFVANGGSGSMDEQAFVEGVAGNLSANSFTRADYVFVSWNTKADGTGTEYTNCQSVTLTESITLYAQWRFGVSTKYKVTFNANGGTGTMADQEFEENVAENLDTNAFTRADYKFTGWNTKADGTGTAYADGQSVTLTESITLYAQWEEIEKPVTYTVEFKYTDGSEALPTVTKDLLSAEDYVLTATDVKDVEHNVDPADYEFLGWTTTVDGTGYIASADIVGKSIKDIDGTTYYAQFKEIEKPVTYTVEFKYTDGSEALPTVTKDLLSADDYVLTATDVKDVEHNVDPADYEFLGWTDTVDGTDYKTSAELQVSIKDLNGKTYYAQFKNIADVAYYVDHYFEQLDGTYVVDTTDTLYARPGTDVTATALTTLPDGYSENTTHPDRVAEGTVPASGELRLSLYYDLEVITVTYYDCGDVAYTIDNGTEMIYEVKYGGTIDNFYDPADDTKTNDEIKAEIENYVEFLTVLGYGKNYDDEYLYNEFEPKDTDGDGVADEFDYSYPINYGGFAYDHEINFKWYVEDDEEDYVVFDEEHVFYEDLDLFSKVKKLNVVISFPEELVGDEVLTLNVPYEESTRFLDSVRDALYLNDNIATYPETTGMEEKMYDKLSTVGGKFFDGDGVFNDEQEINNTDVMIYFYQMMGGKDGYKKWLWEEVEEAVRDALGRGTIYDKEFLDLRQGRNQEQALKVYFVDNYYGVDFTVEPYAEAQRKYFDSEEFIRMSTEEEYFYATLNNEFIMERVYDKIDGLKSVDAVIDEYIGDKIPAGLLNRLPMEMIENIYEPRVERFLADLKEARNAAKLSGYVKEDYPLDSGIIFDINLVEELLIPMMEYAEDMHEAAVEKAVSSDNKAAELIEKYYVDNPYTTGEAGNYGVVNYAFNPYFYVEDTDGDGMYTIRSFKNIYNEVVMPETVETIDALLWYMDPEGGAVDFARIRNLAEENEDLILALHNHPHKLMKQYAENGLPEDMAQYWDDLLSDPDIKEAVEKLDNKVSFDMMYFVEDKINNATLEMYFLKVLNKVGVPAESLLSKYTNSKAYKELTSEDFNKLLDQLEECWETVDGIENYNGTTDYVFDNVLEKVGRSGNEAEAAFKGFEMTITRFFADTIDQVAP